MRISPNRGTATATGFRYEALHAAAVVEDATLGHHYCCWRATGAKVTCLSRTANQRTAA